MAAVSNLIDALVAHRGSPCPEPPNPDGSPGPKRRRWLERETDLEKPLWKALFYHGPVVWLGRLWWVFLPPRDNQINYFPVRNAADCPWPPDEDVQVPGPPVVQKVAGFFPRKEVEHS